MSYSSQLSIQGRVEWRGGFLCEPAEGSAPKERRGPHQGKKIRSGMGPFSPARSCTPCWSSGAGAGGALEVAGEASLALSAPFCLMLSQFWDFHPSLTGHQFSCKPAQQGG